MSRKKPETKTPDGRIKQTPMRLTESDLDSIDRIKAHYHLTSRVDAVRLAVRHVADNMAPITTSPAKKKS